MDHPTPSDLHELTDLRRSLHQMPEVSGAEAATSARIASCLRDLGVDEVVTDLGGCGVAGVIKGAKPGPTVLLRCELDGLPIPDQADVPWRSQRDGTGHLCGHDGHMVTMLAAGRLLIRNRPGQGRVVLMFQPAEEDGSGAIAVCEDPRFAPLAPDWAFAQHNEPDLPRGVAHVPDGLASAPSVGLRMTLAGTEAHACAPWTGISPATALVELMTSLPALCHGRFPEPDYRQLTICHARLGQPSFGISPGEAVLQATLRTADDSTLDSLVAQVAERADETAGRCGLRCEITEHDRFLAGINDPAAATILREAAKAAGIAAEPGQPLRASEDFGRFGHDCPSAMLLLGAGPGPALHNPAYDFDDTLIGPGAALLVGAVRRVLD